jgi:type III secretion protein L
MLLVKKDTFTLETASRLVKAADVAAVARIDEVMETARKEGYEKGLQDGKTEITMQKLDLLESSVQYMEGVEETMCGIVLKALRKCVDEIGDEELVVQVTKKAMRAVVRNQQQIKVRVNDRMVPVVKARMQDILKDFPSVNFMEVVEDSKLDDRACVVETAAGTVDASVDAQIAAIEKSIRKNFAK